jgi:hypothetical protein
VVLCDLEGLTHEQAADRLGCPVGTIKSRLSVARDRLRQRLTRRGLAPAVGAVATALAAESAGAAVSIPLMDSTVHAATVVAAGRAADAAGVVPAAVAALSERVLYAMILSKLKVAATAVAALIVAGIALAQQPATKTTEGVPAVHDRLDQLEQKLDRVLRALEGPGSSVKGATVTKYYGSVAKTPPANEFPKDEKTQYFYPRDNVGASLPADAFAKDEKPQPQYTATYTRASTATSTSALEQRLERLERRVERLEKLIRRDSGEPPAKTP